MQNFTGNYMVDSGLQEQMSSPATGFIKRPPFIDAIKQIKQPKQQEVSIPEYQKFGFKSQQELDIMKDVKAQGGTAQDAQEILEQFRSQNIQQPQQPQEIQGLDVGVKAGEKISGFGEKLKFESQEDDRAITSIAKFFGNLPGDTLQLAGDLIGVASNPVGTVQSVNDFAGSMVETGLNKAFGQNYFTSDERKMISESVGQELQKISDDPSILKDMAVNNPADILFSVTGGLGTAKNAAKAKGMTGLADKLEKAQSITNPLTIQKEAIKGVGKGVSASKNKLFPTKPLDDLLLEVSQGKKADIPKFKEAISSIDIDDVKTYEDLTGTFTSKIQEIAQKQDSLLPTDAIYKVEDLTTTVGNRSTNYIKNALDDLESVGLKENDLELLNKVDELKAKGDLSVKDINDLARFYGSNFKEKSFNKMGDPKSSVSAARFENNRKGLKEISRDLLPDDTAKALDAEMSNLYAARDLSQKMADKVDNLTKKVQPRNLVEKGFRGIADILDYLTLGGPSAFLSRLLPSNVGLKTMNSIGIQERLAKNLKIIDKAIKELDGAKTQQQKAGIITRMAREMGITQEAINNLAGKGKEALGNKLDDLADKTGARAKFMGDEGIGISGKIDDLKSQLYNKGESLGNNKEDYISFLESNGLPEDTFRIKFKKDGKYNQTEAWIYPKTKDKNQISGTLITQDHLKFLADPNNISTKYFIEELSSDIERAKKSGMSLNELKNLDIIKK